MVRHGSCVEEGQGDDDDEAESKPVASFLKALHAFEMI